MRPTHRAPPSYVRPQEHRDPTGAIRQSRRWVIQGVWGAQGTRGRRVRRAATKRCEGTPHPPIAR
jgi:hypothetical protein